MSVTVYIWLPQGNNVGHSSIDVNGNYLSFWPEGIAKKNKHVKWKITNEGQFSRHLSIDIRVEKPQLPLIKTFSNLNEQAMMNYIIGIKRLKPRYQMVRNNCSDIVAECLKIGSQQVPSFTPRASTMAISILLGAVWTPLQIKLYTEELNRRQS